MHLDHSERRACTGSTEAARRAGRYEAIRATANSSRFVSLIPKPHPGSHKQFLVDLDAVLPAKTQIVIHKPEDIERL
jgi:hypothetical protein